MAHATMIEAAHVALLCPVQSLAMCSQASMLTQPEGHSEINAFRAPDH